MLEKIELRKKLKNIAMVKADYSETVINRLQNIVKDKNVCTYIPLENEININMHLKGQSALSTTCIKDGDIKICIYEEPLEKNSFNVYQPINLKIIDMDIQRCVVKVIGKGSKLLSQICPWIF